MLVAEFAHADGAEDERAITDGQRRRPHGPKCVATRLDHRPGGVVDIVGQGQERGCRNRQLIGQCSGKAATDADLEAIFADVVMPGSAPIAVPAPEHRVAGDPASKPARVDADAERRDHAAPLVPRAQWVAGVALVQVGHLPGPELEVGAADAGPVDVDDDLTGPRDRVRNLQHGARAGRGDDERLHRPDHAGTGAPLTSTSAMNSRPESG
jgi:hypothetical protein